MNKKIGSLLIIILVIGSMLTGCGNSLVKKSIEEAKVAIENREYDSAISSLEVALKEDSVNHEANLLYVIVDVYQRSNKLFEEGELDDAKRLLDKIEEQYKDYAIKEDVESLRQKIEDRIEESKLVDSNLTKLEGLVTEKKYTEANSLIEEINKCTLSEEQKSKLEELKAKVDAGLEAIKKAELAEAAKKEEANKKAEAVVKDTATDKNKNTESNNTVVKEESKEVVATTEKKEEVVVVTKEDMVNESVQYFAARGVNVNSTYYDELDGSDFNSGIAELDGHKIFAFTVDSYDFRYFNAWFYYSPETKVGYKYQYRRWTKM